MKKSGKLVFVLVMIAILAGSAWAGGQKMPASGAAKPLVKVNAAVHRNGGGASLTAVAIEKGFFAEYGIEANVTIVESGPAEMAAMRADNPTLDIGYIGPGVAWNPMDSTGNSLSFVFFDQLGKAEKMVARKGIFTPNSSGKFDHTALYNGLRGKTVYMEVGTTPGGWFKDLLGAVNAGRAAGDQLWIHCEVAAYLSGYNAPNNKPENRVVVVNYANANIPAGMATAGSSTVDIAVGFEPIPSTILRTASNVEKIADQDSLPPDKVNPGTFVARTKWLKDNPEVAKNFVYALYKASLWRANNLDESMRITERLCAMPDKSFDHSPWSFPNGAEYREWFANTNAAGYGYLRSLYNMRLPNVPQGTTPKTFEQAFDLTYMLQAIKDIR